MYCKSLILEIARDHRELNQRNKRDDLIGYFFFWLESLSRWMHCDLTCDEWSTTIWVFLIKQNFVVSSPSLNNIIGLPFVSMDLYYCVYPLCHSNTLDYFSMYNLSYPQKKRNVEKTSFSLLY